MTMFRGTVVLFFFTIVAGYAAFSSGAEGPEELKLLYAFFALTTIVCAMVTVAGQRAVALKPISSKE